MSINARGVFLCYKYAGMQMIKQGTGGRIIGASSVLGKQGTNLTRAGDIYLTCIEQATPSIRHTQHPSSQYEASLRLLVSEVPVYRTVH